MSHAPRLSIGLPVYNSEETLGESLEALLGQTFDDFELIISDNASTDGTQEICRHYAGQDSRIRYLRQERNLGRVPNHNFTIQQARGELFKWGASSDLYARDYLRLCVDALDKHPDVVLAHSWSAIVNDRGQIINRVKYPVNTHSPSARERFRSMLFDGWGDDSYGVIRTEVLRRIPPHGSYHFADRTFTTELGLHGPFYHVPDWLYFRRDNFTRTSPFTVRQRCAYMDPRRAARLRNPVVRLYGEYLWAYVAMIRRAPLSPAERRECYRLLTRWLAGRFLPVANRFMPGPDRGRLPLGHEAYQDSEHAAEQDVLSIDTLVAGREYRASP